MSVGSSESGSPDTSPPGNRASPDPDGEVDVLVFAKRPEPGRVKTRLAASIGAECAAELAAAFLEDTVRRVSAWAAARRGVRVAIVGTPADPAVFEPFLGDGVEFRAQSDGHLGDRMRHATGESARLGRSALLLGADTPDFPAPLLDAALHAVRRGVISLTPSTDGGFAQLGIPAGVDASTLDALFDPDEWGTAIVLERARAALRESSTDSEETVAFRDIDELSDLVQWWQSEGSVAETPRTSAVVRAHLATRAEFRRPRH